MADRLEEKPIQVVHPTLRVNDVDTTTTIEEEQQNGDVAAQLLEERLEQAAIVEPPDGGWGWMVVFGSFLANVIVDGVIFTAGAGFQDQWEKEFDSSAGATAWVVSMLSGFYLIAGRS